MLDFKAVQAELYSGVISDVLDHLGYRHQTMSGDIRPVNAEMVVAGTVRPVLSVDVYRVRDDCYDQEIAFVDSLLTDDVVVACTNRSTRTGLWGELLSTAARARGARGCVTDGYVRDVRRIVQMGFPVFAAGMRPVDSKGRSIVFEYDTPVEVGGVPCTRGDVVFGDVDGVVVVPAAIAEQVIAEAVHKVRQESASRAALENGGYLRDVFNRYGVL
ncbi:MAG: RraA family protein [Chloroflexi bacterium]|nr:RraA family protein [Chloroflexota bacterium]